MPRKILGEVGQYSRPRSEPGAARRGVGVMLSTLLGVLAFGTTAAGGRAFEPSPLALPAFAAAGPEQPATAPGVPARREREEDDDGEAHSENPLEEHPVIGAMVLIVAAEAGTFLLSSTARAGHEGRLLAGITAAATIGAIKSDDGRHRWITAAGLLGLAGVELALGAGRASEDDLFWTSFAGLNAIGITSAIADSWAE